MTGHGQRDRAAHDDDAATSTDDAAAVEISREELTAEADQFLNLSGADTETSAGGAAPAGAE